jgi:hypothetical protein
MSSNSSLSTLIIAGDGDDGKDELVKTDSNGEYIMNGPAMNVPALDEFNFKIFSDHEIGTSSVLPLTSQTFRLLGY